jgi:hypothetical protein
MNNAHKHTACLGYVDFKLGRLATSNRAGPDYHGIGLPGPQGKLSGPRGRATWTAGPGYLDRGAGLPAPRGRATWVERDAGSHGPNQFQVEILNKSTLFQIIGSNFSNILIFNIILFRSGAGRSDQKCGSIRPRVSKTDKAGSNICIKTARKQFLYYLVN